jgi:hypothetical protein
VDFKRLADASEHQERESAAQVLAKLLETAQH